MYLPSRLLDNHLQNFSRINLSHIDELERTQWKYFSKLIRFANETRQKDELEPLRPVSHSLMQWRTGMKKMNRLTHLSNLTFSTHNCQALIPFNFNETRWYVVAASLLIAAERFTRFVLQWNLHAPIEHLQFIVSETPYHAQLCHWYCSTELMDEKYRWFHIASDDQLKRCRWMRPMTVME